MIEEEIEIDIPTAEDFVKEIRQTEAKDIKTEFIGRIITIVIAGVGLISVLAWDSAFKDLYAVIFSNADSILGKFGYALIVTFIAVLVSIILGRIFLKKKIKI